MKNRPMIVKSGNVAPLKVLGTEVRFLCEGHHTGSAWSLMEVTLPTDAGPLPHRHGWDEAYFVLAGEVSFSLGEEAFVARAGDFIYTPGGALHGFKGVSSEPARMLIFDAPAHAGTFFRRVDHEVRPGEIDKVFAIGEQTGICFELPA